MTALPRLYAIADSSFGDPAQLAAELFRGGARLVQVRSKSASAAEFLHQVETVLAARPEGARVIVNDRVDVALLAGASGAHVGQTDLPAVEARKILGGDAIVGVSTHHLDQAIAADALPVDYIAVGPIFPTTTKANPDPPLGLAALTEICRSVRKPVVAIGGITLETAMDVLDCGAASLAVVGGILQAENVRARTDEWLRRIGEA